MMDGALPTGVQLTALDPSFREDPYPILAELRRRDPVHHDSQLGRYFFTRHDDVAYILRNPAFWSDPRKGNEGGFARGYLGRGDEEPSMLMMDDPGHRRLRSLVSAPFTPRAVERWRGRCREIAREIIGSIEQSTFDLVAKVAAPIPTVVIAEMLGVDASMHEQFKRWSDAALKVAFSPINSEEDILASESAFKGLGEYLASEIEQRRVDPLDDLISAMVFAEVDGDCLGDQEIIQQCELLLLAGNLTTTDLIGNAAMAFVRNPEELEKLRARPDLIGNAVEEVLRFDSAVTDSGRIANQDIEIGGVKIGVGESLTISLAAANRDPAIYPDPDSFDIERVDTHHQAFGGGRHFCLGAHLARIELQETLRALFFEFSEISLSEHGYSYASNPSFRGFSELWVGVES